MITYRCDGCGVELAQKALRYTVTIDVRAAYDQIEVGLADLMRDFRAELIQLIERLKDKPPQELEESVYKCIKLDLCPSCQRAFLRSPLRFHPEQGTDDAGADIDAFLRSLGWGNDAEGGSGHT